MDLYDIQMIIIFNCVTCCDIYKSGAESVYTYNYKTPDDLPGSTIIINVPAGVAGEEVKLSILGRKGIINIEVYGKIASNSY